MSYSITAHERSSSTWVLAVSKMVLNKFNAMLVWSMRPGSILGCLATGTVMEKRKLKDLLFFIFSFSVFNYMRKVPKIELMI
jgi:hypothetical protein